jgi:elongation factor P
MLSYNELKPGIFIVLDGQPFLVLESQFLRMQQRKPVMKTKLKNLFSGGVTERSFQQTDQLEEADLERMKAKFLYSNRGDFWFCEEGNPPPQGGEARPDQRRGGKNRFMLKAETVGDSEKFLKPNLEVEALKFNGEIISFEIPIKVDYKVAEAPPAVRGNTAQGGTKSVTIETGAKINVPLFINEGDVIRINTQTGDYVERVEKS